MSAESGAITTPAPHKPDGAFRGRDCPVCGRQYEYRMKTSLAATVVVENGYEHHYAGRTYVHSYGGGR